MSLSALVIAGPTASGKSALALAVAEEFRGTLINADSMQVYRDLAVLTARPGATELLLAPHRLYGIVDAAEAFSVGAWRALALAEIARAHAAGRLPILIGGTGLYLRALLRGLAEVPPVPPEVRAEARALHAAVGGEAFHARLAALDPAAAAALRPSDPQRLIRAYEVVRATGRSLVEWQRQDGAATLRGGAIVLLPPRAALYAACDRRFLEMMAAGALEEVKALLARGLPPDVPAMKAVGVPELAALLAGGSTREAAIAAAQQATRRLAKRQFTWLRHQMPEGPYFRKLVLSEQFSEWFLPGIFAFIRGFLLTLND